MNEEIDNAWKVWKTCLELVKDRDYSYNNAYNKVKLDEFKYLVENNLFEIIANNENEKRAIYIKLLQAQKIKSSNLKDIIEQVKNKYDEETRIEIIFILWVKPNSTLKKLEKDRSIDDLQIVWYKQLLFNPTKHMLVPKHTKMSDKETEELLKKFSIKNPKLQLPTITRDDPIVRYFNFKTGDILKIEKTIGITNYNYCNYRYVR